VRPGRLGVQPSRMISCGDEQQRRGVRADPVEGGQAGGAGGDEGITVHAAAPGARAGSNARGKNTAGEPVARGVGKPVGRRSQRLAKACPRIAEAGQPAHRSAAVGGGIDVIIDPLWGAPALGAMQGAARGARRSLAVAKGEAADHGAADVVPHRVVRDLSGMLSE